MRIDWPGCRGKAALVAALLFVIQSLLSAHALGAGAAAAPRDAFGNPLCIAGTEHAAQGSGSDKGDRPGCCKLGCLMASAAFALPADAAGWHGPLPVFRGASFAAFRSPALPERKRRWADPRAPPAA